MVTCELISVDKTKPKELKGIKQAKMNGKPANIMFAGTKGAWKLFVKGDDLFIHATDFFSPTLRAVTEEDRIKKINSGTLSLDEKNRLLRLGELDIIGEGKFWGIDYTRKKFNYSDNWGTFVLRIQAWLVFRNIMNFGGRFIELVQEIAKGLGKITGNSAVDIQIHHNDLISNIAEAVYRGKLEW